MIVTANDPDGSSAISIHLKTVRLFLLALILFLHGAVGNDDYKEITHYRSRPDLSALPMTLELKHKEKLTPGYIFLTPYEIKNPGPYIFDTDGNLVWSGWGWSGPGTAHGMHTCQYKGSNHLCFFQGHQEKGYSRGHGIIMDNRYRIVRSVQPGGGMSSSDMHEFRPINGGRTALMTIYQPQQYDMTKWNIKTGVGWVMDSIFQEVDVETGAVLFEWRSLDHIDPRLGFTPPTSTDTSGSALSPHSPWDFFHINSIDKNEDGDYLISSRHMCAIYKISGKDGSVIWHLHGANPSFRNINFSFSQQHDARWLMENSTHTVLSLFNNGFNGYNQTHDYSSGMIIVIDHVEKTATKIREYTPKEPVLSSSQGNLQILPNGNAFVGWGNKGFVSEYAEDGELVLWGYFSQDAAMNYRVQKFDWDADPTDIPALWAYARAVSDSLTTLYVSWNGATKVKKWRFFGSKKQEGLFKEIGTTNKAGFETAYTDSNFHRWCYVEALDAKGKVLGRSTTKFTFVPSPELSKYCGDTFCDYAPDFGNPNETDARPTVPPPATHRPEGWPWELEDEEDEEDDDDDANDYDGDRHRESQHEGAQSIGEHPKMYSQPGHWLLPFVEVGSGLSLGLLLLHFFNRRRQQANPFQRGSLVDDTVNLKFSHLAYHMPWWHWRRWATIAELRRQKYFPSMDRQSNDGDIDDGL
ncbi:hypothetical protein Egran_06964 [Elaphomyces granulatus]|uniref:ASST-domain-containing protein n=1 Tax=Elaphomyces granulatus TaxID=519963 RepID=A0A232LMP9_9EURO|nr:hypothetical protein Egran_06964 [Elaphomyces granulatus]